MSVTCGPCFDKDRHFESECRDPEGCSCCGKEARALKQPLEPCDVSRTHAWAIERGRACPACRERTMARLKAARTGVADCMGYQQVGRTCKEGA